MASPVKDVQRRWVYLPPAIWAAFAWLYILVLSQAANGTFYALVRGIGAIRYSSAIVVGSRELDLALLAVGGISVLVVHVLCDRSRIRSSVPVVAILGFGAGLVGTVLTGWLVSVFVLGLSAAGLVEWDAGEISKAKGGSAKELLALFIFDALAVCAVLALIGGTRWIIGGFDGATPLKDPSWSVAFAGLQAVGLLDPIIGPLALLFLFSWAIRLALPPLLRRFKSVGWFGQPRSAHVIQEGREQRRLAKALLGAAIVISFFVGIYPYLPAVNPNALLVGVDVRCCYSTMLANQYVSGPWGNNTALALSEHYGAIEMLRGLVTAFGSVNTALVLAPVLLGVLLVTSTFVLALEGTGDYLVAGVSALFGATSPEIIAGINAGIIADWLGICLVFFFFAVVIHALRTGRRYYVLLGCPISILALAVHPWVWALSIGVTAAVLVLSILQTARRTEAGSRTEISLLALILVGALAVDGILAYSAGRSGIGIASSSLLTGLSLPTVASIVANLQETFVAYLLGGLANPFWFILGMAGVLSISKLNDQFGKILATWIASTSIAALLTGATPEFLLMRWLLYALPIQIFAAMGFVTIYRALAANLNGNRLRSILLIVAMLSVIGLSVGFALDNVGYLFRGVPGS